MTKNRVALSVFLFLASTLPALAKKPAHPTYDLPAHPPTWAVSWATSQQIPEPQNALPADDLRDTTLRQIVHLSRGGYALRIHISNAFGATALHLTSVHIAHPISPADSAIDSATDRALTFAGHSDVSIPPGAEILSDPIDTLVPALSDLAVTIHYDAPPSVQTGHPGSRATSYYVHGDAVSAAQLDAPKKIDHWYQISAIDVLANAPATAIVALGDSITDGHGATTNGNDRWTDVLATRLQSSSPDSGHQTPDPYPGPQTLDPLNIGVANAGIGGNHLLTDGLGPNALARFDRDVLAQAGVRFLIVFEGVNDLGGLAINGEVPQADHDTLVARVIAAYQQIIVRAHAHGLRVYGATITPYVGSGYYHPGPLSEADRQTVNTWIRRGGTRAAAAPGNRDPASFDAVAHFDAVPHFDAVLDFDAVVRDPAHPDQLLPAYDCGDHLHPNPAGYRAIANSIPLNLFTQ
jgi:lysophospholipase L1-like esterase